jgi:membrane protease subunit HflK
MTKSSKKAQSVSLLGLIVTGVFCAVTLIIGVVLDTCLIIELGALFFSTTLIWLVLLIQFFARSQAEQEKLDRAKLMKDKSGTALFEGAADRLSMFDVAQKRLAGLEKWFVPISGVVIAVLQILIGLFLLRGVSGDLFEMQPKTPLLGAMLLIGISFVSLLISRYATGLSGEEIWRPLRAGGSTLLAAAVLGLAAAVGLALYQYKYDFLLRILEWVVPILLIVLGAEILLTAVFDVYRPRVAGEYNRAVFDSRLLGLINEPGGILHTVSNTLDYQFGFRVSETWFYRLLEKAILPLGLFMALILYLMSTVVVVQPGQGAIIERLGSADPARGGRQVGAGWAWKWPWPFEKAYLFPVERLQQTNLGFVEADDQEKGPLLWGKQHFKEEYDLLVAVETRGSRQAAGGAVPVSIVRANVPIHYRIRDLYKYLYVHRNAGAMFESICCRELTRFAASAKIETDLGDGKSLLGAGRQEGSEELRRRIQQEADRADLGVEVVYLGLQGVHPPPDVAEDYQALVGAVQQKQAKILEARAQRNKTLTELAGSIEEVETLYELIHAFAAARQQQDGGRFDELTKQLEDVLGQVRGSVYSTIRQAEAYASEQIARAQGEGARFAGQVKADRANSEIYRKLQRLLALEDALEKIRKYVVITDQKDTQIYIIDLMEQLSPDLLDMDLSGISESVVR